MQDSNSCDRPDVSGPVSSLKRLPYLVTAVVALFVAASCAAHAQSPLASPAIDESLFKDGAVESREGKFDSWYAKCQEIVKIKRRICNLLSTVEDNDGKAQGSVLVATADNGEPTMMIAITGPILKDQPITVEATFDVERDNKKKAVPVPFRQSINAAQCDPNCKFMFPFDSKLVYVLNAGNEISVLVPIAASLDQAMTGKLKKKKNDVLRLSIRGTGFAAALKASTQPW